MVTKKDCVERVAREIYGDRNFAKKIADKAERRDYKEYDTIIEEGKRLFMKDFEKEGANNEMLEMR